MKGLTVMFNADEILRKNIFNQEDSERQEKLEQVVEIVKSRYSSRFQNCRFFFSLFPDEDAMMKLPTVPKRFQWTHFNALCFDNFRILVEFDEQFTTFYNAYLSKAVFEKLKFYDRGNDMYIMVDYKAQIKRSATNENNNDEMWHAGYLGLNSDGVMLSIQNVNY